VSSFELQRRRYRVVARPKDRRRRVRATAAVAAVAVLGAVAFLTIRKVVSDFALPSAAAFARVDAAIVDGPEPLRALAQETADATRGTAGDKAEAIKARFPSVADVRVRRAWTEKTATLTLVPRRAVAAATRKGKAAGFLDSSGVVFAAPEGAFVLTGPTVEVAGASAAELAALAREWPELAASGAFPAPLEAMAFRSFEDGWEARLADGAVVLWGRLDWTKEKLSRLGEAVADAKSKEPGVFSADLRWFEDGKVLLKPSALRPGALK
jgi:cell division septal protein FtsQ